jgi:hypothetical protein
LVYTKKVSSFWFEIWYFELSLWLNYFDYSVMENRRELPAGVQDFEKLRTTGCVYVTRQGMFTN